MTLPSAELLTYAQAAAFLGVSVRTLRRAVARGHVREPVKFGGCVRFYRADMDEFLVRLRSAGTVSVDRALVEVRR